MKQDLKYEFLKVRFGYNEIESFEKDGQYVSDRDYVHSSSPSCIDD